MTRRCYLLVGVGRSGTSAIAGTFYRSQFEGNPVQMLDLIPANKGNPKGFYEDREVVRLNDTILHDAGTWVLCANDTNFGHLLTDTRYDDVVREVLLRYDSPCFCIKDPRLTLTLPVYVRVLQTMGVECRVVHIRRHYQSIISSFQSRDGLTRERARKLIEKYRLTLDVWCKRLQDISWEEIEFEKFMAEPLTVFSRHFPAEQPNIIYTLKFLGKM